MIDLLFNIFLIVFFVIGTLKIFWPSKAERDNMTDADPFKDV